MKSQNPTRHLEELQCMSLTKECVIRWFIMILFHWLTWRYVGERELDLRWTDVALNCSSRQYTQTRVKLISKQAYS